MLRLMDALGFWLSTTVYVTEVEMPSLHKALGEVAFESPTVFSFFLPEYQPAGAAQHARLLAPEAQLATAPYLIGFLNGAQSLIKFGLSSCQGGVGPSRSCPRHDAYNPRADGYLTWRPSKPTVDATIDGLDLLLTGGRLELL